MIDRLDHTKNQTAPSVLPKRRQKQKHIHRNKIGKDAKHDELAKSVG